MSAENELTATMNRLKRRLRDSDKLVGIGIGLVEGKPGVVVSVEAGGVDEARAAVNSIEASVPVTIRTVGPVRKRPSD